MTRFGRGRLVANSPADSSNPRLGELTITAERHRQTLVLGVRGEVDLVSAPQLEKELRTAATSGANLVVLDLAGVEFMDASGLHALLRARQHFERKRRQLALARIHPHVRRLLELTGADRLFHVEGRRETSIARVPRRP